MTPNSSASAQAGTTLPPDYRLPLAVFAIGLALIFLGNALLFGNQVLSLIELLLGIVITLFSFFLMLQTVIIRLTFTDQALEVYRSEQRIREFPYSEWLNWKIFWPRFPILFYFREVNSIHFLPILFNSKMLRQCLEEHCSVN